MRHRNVLIAALSMAALGWAGGRASAQLLDFTDRDWILHRGTPTRQGGNNDPGLPGLQLDRIWVYPPTADMPAEMVVDNTTLPVPAQGPQNGEQDPGQRFSVAGAWTYPPFADRAFGAWPASSTDGPLPPASLPPGVQPGPFPQSEQGPEKINDYLYATPEKSNVLAGAGIDMLARFPNIGTDPAAAAIYKQVNDDLDETLPGNGNLMYARWAFGTGYPYFTQQGRRVVSPFDPAAPGDTTRTFSQPLAANQRYAVYIRFPNSGTLVGGEPRPNTDHVMVRVSWGATLNDPKTSRIFMVNFGETGGFWKRIRSGAGDDRYFPYDGTNPITVTLYTRTPDDLSVNGQPNSIITADAVRLVPEALRGDIHASAASAMFPGTALPVARTKQRTYFGRDETTGPIYPKTLVDAVKYPPNGFPAIGFDPTKPIHPVNNPAIGDPSSSLRTAVFYCVEDDIANNRYGKLIWRYVARTTPVSTTTVDDLPGPPGFTATNVGNPTGWTQTLNAADLPYATTYYTAPVTSVGETATWEAPLTDGKPGSTYSVFVWIPGGNVSATEFAHFARYTITADQGSFDVVLDQRNTAGAPATNGVGMWRRLASGVRFPAGIYNGNPVGVLGSVTVHSESPQDVAEGGGARRVVADAVQFVAESQASNSVVAAPLIANVTFATGDKQVVYFATTDGHVWALDALGANETNPGSTLTTAYWVYPSISNPNPAGDKNGNGAYDGEEDDPNFQPDPTNNRPPQGYDGDLEKSVIPDPANPNASITVYRPVNQVPDLGPFVSSPVYMQVRTGLAPNFIYRPYIVIGNQNGRIYALDPAGRSGADAAIPAAADNPGTPGTTRRLMTWPTTARDKWLRKGGLLLGQDSFKQFTDDPGKAFFSASPTVPITPGDAFYVADRVIAGAGDGHVYCIDMQSLNQPTLDRISNSNVGNATDGAPRWQYPAATKQLPPITLPGALSTTFDKFVFSAGGRVYAIDNPATQTNGAATLQWVYPFTSAPPGTPAATDKPQLDTDFTAPALRSIVGLNAGNPIAFVANRDGRIFALDAMQTGGAEPATLWVSTSQGPTRSSVTMYNGLTPQPGFSAPFGPALLLPSDTGGILGIDATIGFLKWNIYDSVQGGVPVYGSNADLLVSPTGITPLPWPTQFGWRGADATISNTFVYQGDEGNQDTGEMNGQMRAYGSSTIGIQTPGEFEYRVDERGVELRMVELWNAKKDDPTNNTDTTLIWERLDDPTAANAISPYTARLANLQKPNTQNGVVVYEWGDTIYAAAWGLYKDGSTLPQVTFTLSGGASPRTVTVGARPDRDLAVSALPWAMVDPTNPMGAPLSAHPWVAKYAFPLGRGSEADPQTPGRFYRVTASAQQISASGFSAPTFQLSAGQFDPPVVAAPLPPADPRLVPTPRTMVLAHPFSITTRGVPTGPTTTGMTVYNTLGWTTNYNVNNATIDLSEVVSNGDIVATVAAGGITPLGLKDMVAPLGMVSHGTTAAYKGVDDAGKQVPALFMADRSNLYKLGQKLNGLRVARSEMRWGWNPTIPAQQVTGNVMNPLPWEVFPNTIPNISPDYPDVDRTRSTFQLDGVDLASRPVALDWPIINAGIKTLKPTTLDLLVEIPKYQPANVNRDYFDIRDSAHTSTGSDPTMPDGLLAPMQLSSGRPPTTSGALRGLVSPSAGYYGTYVVFVDSNNDGRYQGTQAQKFNQAPPAITGGREEVFRQVNVAAAVPPDINFRTEEETIDIGNLPHGMGYHPNFPFQPSFQGNYAVGSPQPVSPWDTVAGRDFFLPFTLKNQGNVNLINVRMAKILGDYGTDFRDPNFWVRMTSDQVDPLTNEPIWALNFNFLGAPAVGNIGIVSALDRRDAVKSPWENSLWPYVMPGALAPNDYVQAPNVNGWATGTRQFATAHKPLVGTAPEIMSIPDVAAGDRLGMRSAVQALYATADGKPGRDLRPSISVAIPLTTPAGTYTATMLPYEDSQPIQWREWVYFYRQKVNGAALGPPTYPSFGDDDGILNVTTGTAFSDARMLAEAKADPGFRLKVAVRESRITNGASDGSFIQVDDPPLNPPTFGANNQPAAIRDPATGKLILFWSSNRPNNNGPAPTTPDTPWFLQYSTLNSVNGNVPVYGPRFDWRYETGLTRWWDPLPANSQYPGATVNNQVFPAQTSDLMGNPNPANTPLIPGLIAPETVRHVMPATAQDDDPAKANPPVWLFWQGSAYKNASSGATTQRLDSRTYYIQLVNGVPPANTLPFSFLNDPTLPKFSPKPLIITDQNNATMHFLFWYGGGQGRTRLYFNVNTGDPTNPALWSADVALPTPGTLQWQADPVPIHRRVFTTAFVPAGQFVDAIDLVYTATLPNRRQAETLLTRYAIQTAANGSIRLVVIPLTPVDNETMVRDATSNTWSARDMAWNYRNPVDREFLALDPADNIKKPLFQIFVYNRAGASVVTYPGGAPAPINGYNPAANNFTAPTFDNATGRLYFSSVLGGQVIVDPQTGAVTFSGVAPKATDRVVARYVPQSLRLNVTRNDSGVIAAPAAWANDPGFVGRPHVPPTGSNTGPAAFIDRTPNPRRDLIDDPAPAANANAPAVTRLWLFYRKTNANVTSPAALYYKTMRLMVRLPRGIIRDYDPNTNTYTVKQHVRIARNRGPYEIDWIRGRIYFTEADEGNDVEVDFDYGRNGNNVLNLIADYRVGWGDEISTAVTPGDQTTNEVILPTDSAVNEGQLTAFKDPMHLRPAGSTRDVYQDKVWLFWVSTRAGVPDLFYMTISPLFYPQALQ